MNIESLIVAVSGVLATLFGVLALIGGKKSEAITEVSAVWDELRELRKEVDELRLSQTSDRREIVRLKNYALLLRGLMQADGKDVPPWPDSLTKD